MFLGTVGYFFIRSCEPAGTILRLDSVFLVTFMFLINLFFSVSSLLTVIFSPDNLFPRAMNNLTKKQTKDFMHHQANMKIFYEVVTSLEVGLLAIILILLLLVQRELKNFVVLYSEETQSLRRQRSITPPTFNTVRSTRFVDSGSSTHYGTIIFIFIIPHPFLTLFRDDNTNNE